MSHCHNMQMDLSTSIGRTDPRPLLNDLMTQLHSLQFDLMPTIRLRMPDRFCGDPIQFRYWNAQVKNFLKAHRTLYSTDASKIALYISLMTHDALNWITPFIEDDDPVLEEFSQFMTLMEDRFKEPACPVDSRLIDNELEYKVHWRGYRVSQQSWEPAQSLINAPSEFHEFTRIFHAANPEKPPHSESS